MVQLPFKCHALGQAREGDQSRGLGSALKFVGLSPQTLSPGIFQLLWLSGKEALKKNQMPVNAKPSSL